MKINVKKTKSLTLRISEKTGTLFNEKINQVVSFTYLGTIISEDRGFFEDVKI